MGLGNGFSGCAAFSRCMGFSSGVASSDLFTHLSRVFVVVAFCTVRIGGIVNSVAVS
jgi:hypothetical protein